MSKDVFTFIAFLVVAFCLVGILTLLEQTNYEKNMAKHCEQYYSIPEQHIDRIPDGCVPQYFQHKESL